MPAPALDVDREAVKAHAITHGVRQAARAFNLPESTVKSWSTREGWLKDAGKAVVVQPLPRSLQPIACSASSASIAAIKTKLDAAAKRRQLLAKAATNGARHLSRLPGEAVVASADRLLQITNATAKIDGWQDGHDRPSTTVNVALMGIQAQPVPAPVIDVQSTPTE